MSGVVGFMEISVCEGQGENYTSVIVMTW
jgi:hypothetical protein